MQFNIQLKLAALFACATAVLGGPSPVVGNGAISFDEMVKQLSKIAQIYLPGSPGFDLTVARWSNASQPIATIVIEPTCEDDVAKTIKFANKYSIPFLAFNGVHGAINTLGAMDYGIAIGMKKLNSIKIAKDGKTATIGGGVMSRNITDALWAAGKQTVTGTCECVSYLGPALGGGHGWLQGRYGLISDQFVSARVVLADGTPVTIDKNSKLFWALKGAGHNFGIVTSMTSKIYDLVRPDYALATLFFTGDQVEDVYRVANEQWYASGKAMPVDLINWSYWFFDPTIDAEKPVIAMYIIQEGVKTVSASNTAAFLALKPIIVQNLAGDYRDLAKWTGISLSDGPCQITGNANPRFPIYLKQYNTTAQAQIYNLFREATTNATGPFGRSLFMFEGYPQQAVQSLAKDATAFAYREDNLLVAPLLSHAPTGPAVEAEAQKLGNAMRQILYNGSGQTSLHTYVNYAYGDETAKAWYGSDAWRQQRLQALKQEFDPKSKFSFYAPISQKAKR